MIPAPLTVAPSLPTRLALRLDGWTLAAPEILILAYFALHTLIRSLLPIGPGLDEAGEMVTTQVLAWGYGPQPPLYSWLQWGLFQILGANALALALLKNALLAVTFLTVLRIARRVLPGDAATAGMFGLLLLPQIAWESQRALSHTVLAVALTALAVERILMLMETRRTRDYVALGLIAGLGLLSKYNFPFLPAAVMISALWTAEGRAALLDRRSLIVLALAALIALPHGLWAVGHMKAVTAHLDKFQIGDGILMPRLLGLATLLGAAAAFLALLATVHAAILWRARGTGTPLSAGWAVLARALVLAAAGIALLVLATGATNVKDRWLQPLLFLSPVAAAGWVAARREAASLRWVNRAAVAAMLAVLVAVPINALTLEIGRAAWGDVAAALRRAAPDAATVLADIHTHAGALRHADPTWTVFDDDMPDLGIAVGTPLVIVWNRGANPPPQRLLDIARHRLGAGTLSPPERVEVTRWPWTRRRLDLGFAVYRRT